MATIFPSLISADLLNLATTITAMDPYCAGYHIDIMDNHFVPNLTWGPQFANAIAKKAHKQLWIHLMVQEPYTLLHKLVLPSKSIISFHPQAGVDTMETLQLIQTKQWLPSIALNPKTDVSTVLPYAQHVYQMLVMSVEPGFSGQPFIENSINKVNQLAAYKEQHGLSFTIGIDGGITQDRIVLLKDQGVDQFAIASAIFDTQNPVETVRNFSALAT